MKIEIDIPVNLSKKDTKEITEGIKCKIKEKIIDIINDNSNNIIESIVRSVFTQEVEKLIPQYKDQIEKRTRHNIYYFDYAGAVFKDFYSSQGRSLACDYINDTVNELKDVIKEKTQKAIKKEDIYSYARNKMESIIHNDLFHEIKDINGLLDFIIDKEKNKRL